MITDEIWVPVLGSRNYEISSFGNVRNVHNKNMKSQRKTKKGYLVVTLKEDGVKKCRYVHRLVAEALIPNPDCLPQVNHKDENKENNNVDNLEWCTASYNISYGTGPTRRGTKLKGRISPNSKAVLQIDAQDAVIGRFHSIVEAEKALGICSSHIGQVANGKRKTAGGFFWTWA